MTEPRRARGETRAPRRPAKVPTQRELFRRAARDLGVSAADYERADILAQIAELLRQHPAIGRLLAFKGGAIMTLVDRSPRLSADLDAVVVTGGAIHDRHIRAALMAELDRKRIVTDVGIVDPGRQSLQYPFIKTRSFSGLGDVNIRLEVSWREPLLLPTDTVEVHIPRDVRLGLAPRVIRLPVLARIERVAEKVRAFLERGLDRDAFDLHHHARSLSSGDRTALRGLIRRKLQNSELPDGCDLKALLATALDSARQSWPRGLVIVADPPEWTDVERTIAGTYEPLLQRHLRRTEWQ